MKASILLSVLFCSLGGSEFLWSQQPQVEMVNEATLFTSDESKHGYWYVYPNVYPILESNLGILKDFERKGIPSPESSLNDFYLLVWLRTLTAYNSLLKYQTDLSPEELKKQKLIPGNSDAETIKKLLVETQAFLELKHLSGEKMAQFISLIKTGDVKKSYAFLSSVK